MAKPQANVLLTEGRDDVHAVIHLMSSYVVWGETKEERPVTVEFAGGIPELLNADYLNASFKLSGLEAIGILLDANDTHESRWESVRNLCRGSFPEIPATLDPSGLIVEGANGIRLGIWIMPDNQSHGMLEDFLAHLVPEGGLPLWEHAQEATQRAEELSAPFKAVHSAKAQIHTWLSWQEPPGMPFGIALKAKCLDATRPSARPFVEWFIELYQLQDQRAE